MPIGANRDLARLGCFQHLVEHPNRERSPANSCGGDCEGLSCRAHCAALRLPRSTMAAQPGGSLERILTENVPVRDVLTFPPQPVTSPLAIEASSSSFTGIDFAPGFFAGGPVE